MEPDIVNKVASSSLISFDLETLLPKGERILFDLKPLLFQELVLKEKDFREFLKNHPWEDYRDAHVAITCSADAIVPTWAFMLVSLKLEPFAKTILFGNLDTLEDHLWEAAIAAIPNEQFIGAKVVIKGCSKVPVPVSAYVLLSKKLRPLASSIMYGEPCSTVPLYKSPR